MMSQLSRGGEARVRAENNKKRDWGMGENWCVCVCVCEEKERERESMIYSALRDIVPSGANDDFILQRIKQRTTIDSDT